MPRQTVLTFAGDSRKPCGIQRTLLSLIAGLLLATDSFAAKPPNVVLIISDDQSWTDYSFMGHEAIETPNLDRLARQSRLFKRGYVPTSLCCPSLATMITGLFPHQHRITGNEPPIPAEGKNTEQYRNQVQECVGFIDTVPHPAPASGQARLRQSSVRQMVAGTLFARRLHPRHDPRRPQAPGTPRRRRIENRPRRVAADF